jgi:hypothetical protein
MHLNGVEVRENLTVLNRSLHQTKLPLLIFVNKGIEIGTDALTLEIIADTCGADVAKAATFIVSLGSDHFCQLKLDFLIISVRAIFCERK